MANYDLPDWRARLRTALGDTAGPPYLWDDDTVDGCVLDAISQHSLLFPQITRWTAAVANGQQEWTLPAERFAVLGVELAGVLLPQGDQQTTAPAGSAASRAVRGDGLAQSYRGYQAAGAAILRLRQAALPADVGGATLAVRLAGAWTRPTAGVGLAAGFAWDGPELDVPLVLLLARRAAYQILAEWQARAQGLTTPTIAGGVTNVHLEIPPILAALEVAIARALALRQARDGALPPLPPGH